MSTSNAEMYGRRARDAQDFKEVGNNVKRAVDELIRAIKALETRVSRLCPMKTSGQVTDLDRPVLISFHVYIIERVPPRSDSSGR